MKKYNLKRKVLLSQLGDKIDLSLKLWNKIMECSCWRKIQEWILMRLQLNSFNQEKVKFKQHFNKKEAAARIKVGSQYHDRKVAKK